MPIDTPSKFHVDSSFSSRGDSTLNSSSSRPSLSRISTSDDEDGPCHIGRIRSRYPSLGTVVEVPQVDNEGVRLEEDIFKAASAPEATSAFPQDGAGDNAQQTPDPAFMASPAQMFLSMFTPAKRASPLPDTEGETVAGYTLGQIIGRGGFSTVRKATSASGAVVAVKIVKRLDMDRQENPGEARRQLDNEVEIWRTLNHEHILPLFATERTLYADFFVTLFCPAGSLFDILKRDGRPALPQDDAGMLFRQVVRGLRYLHEGARLVHGDIKLENVLVDETGMCRISDFGLSRSISNSAAPLENQCGCEREAGNEHALDRVRRHSTISHATSAHIPIKRHCGPSRHRNSTPHSNSSDLPTSLPFHHFHPGSLPYASPELLSPPTSGNCPFHAQTCQPNPAQDMWALGVLLYALLSGRLPFWDGFEPRLQMKILHATYDLPPGIGHGAERVLKGCLEPIVLDRWTIDMVDDVAWGIGWGVAGDVDVSVSPMDERELVHGMGEYRKSRPHSRTRPYPDHAHLHTQDPSAYGEALTPVCLSSASRSHSRATRQSSHGNGKTIAERVVGAPPMSASVSNTIDSPYLPGDVSHSLSPFRSYPPALIATGGRRGVNNSGSRMSSTSRSRSESQSLSHSRSRSWSASPTTPPDAGTFGFGRIGSHNNNHAVDEQKNKHGDEESRGRRRTVMRKDDDAGFETRLSPGFVKEAELELPAKKWPSSLDQDLLLSLGGG